MPSKFSVKIKTIRPLKLNRFKFPFISGWRWPKSVPAGKDETGFVEFEHGRGYHRFDNAGEVDYELEGAGIKFRIHSDEKFNPQLYATLDGFPAVNLIWKEGAFLYLFISGNKDNLDIKKIY